MSKFKDQLIDVPPTGQHSLQGAAPGPCLRRICGLYYVQKVLVLMLNLFSTWIQNKVQSTSTERRKFLHQIFKLYFNEEIVQFFCKPCIASLAWKG